MAQTKAQLLGPVVGDVVMDVSTLSLDAEGNKVGIGHSEPDLTLHVSGVDGLPSSSGSTSTGHLTLRDKATSTKGMFFGVSNASPFGSWIQAQDSANNATNYPLLLNPNGGNVGIGIANPATDFHLHSSSSGSNSEILLTNGDTGSSVSDGFKIALNTGAGGEIWNYENDYIRLGTNNEERIRITSAGKVGIGSDNPGATLDLQSTDTEILLKLNTKPVKNGYLDIVSDANRRGIIRFQDTDGTTRWSIGKGDSDELTNTSFHISSGSSGGGAAKLIITSDGKVGIGINPTEKFHINGGNGVKIKLDCPNDYSNSSSIIMARERGEIKTTIDASGGNPGGTMVLRTRNTVGTMVDAITIENNQQVSINSVAGTHPLTVSNGGTQRFRITSAGQMGLGANNPGDYDAEANDFVVRSANHTGITIASSGSNQRCNLYFSDGTSGNEKYRGAFTYDHSDDSMMMRTGGTPRLLIDSSGRLLLGTSSCTEIASQVIQGSSYGTSDPGILYLSRGTSSPSNTQTIGSIRFSDNTQKPSALISVMRDGGTWSSTSKPGYLSFQTSSDGSVSPTERLRIDSAGNMGLGNNITKTWSLGKALHIGVAENALWGEADYAVHLMQNAYYNSGYKYTHTDEATLYSQEDGRHSFKVAASGSADSAITWAEALRITSAGLIGISETTPDSKLDILHSTSTNSSTENLIHLRTDPGAGYVTRGLFVKIGRDGNYDNSAAHYDIVGNAGNSGFHAFEVQGSEKLRITKEGSILTARASNITYTTSSNASIQDNEIFKSPNPVKQNSASASYYNMKAFYPHKDGSVSMKAEMYILSGGYYFNFRVVDENDTVVFDAGDGGGYNSYNTAGSGNVHNYKTYKWVCPNLRADKRYKIQMAASNSGGTSIYASASQDLFLRNFAVYSYSTGVTDHTAGIHILQDVDNSNAANYGGTLHQAMNSSSNVETINYSQSFSGTESRFLGWYTIRAYNRYLDVKFNMNYNAMWFAQAYGYLYNRGHVCGSMISGYTYTNNQILAKSSHTFGTRGWYGSYRDSNGYLCLKFDSGANGYNEGRIGIFFGSHGPNVNDIYITHYQQNDSTSNLF